MNYAHLLEAFMLICFGFSWPLNLSKAYKAGTTKGMSLPFILLIITGYLAGISAKIMNGQFNYVLAVYLLNLVIVMVNLCVYFRNKSLDKKRKTEKSIPVIEIKKNVEKEETMYNYTNSLDEYINRKPAAIEKKNGVILMGGNLDEAIPLTQLASEYNFNFDIYNKSNGKLSIAGAKEYFEKAVAPLAPEGILLHLGENDLALLRTNPAAFDKYYEDLIAAVKDCNRNCRIALVSIDNPNHENNISIMNAHIRAIAQAEKASYVNLENAKLWNPQATKAACNFAYSMGLKTRKPLNDVAEILYSYAYHNLSRNTSEVLAG